MPYTRKEVEEGIKQVESIKSDFDLSIEDRLAINALLSLATEWLEVAGEMPEKREVIIVQGHITGLVGDPIKRMSQKINEGWNAAIDACALSMMGKYVKVEELLNEKEITEILEDTLTFKVLGDDAIDSGFLPAAAKAIRQRLEKK